MKIMMTDRHRHCVDNRNFLRVPIFRCSPDFVQNGRFHKLGTTTYPPKSLIRPFGKNNHPDFALTFFSLIKKSGKLEIILRKRAGGVKEAPLQRDFPIFQSVEMNLFIKIMHWKKRRVKSKNNF